MDDEARQRLIVQATVQNAQQELTRARANLPLGIVLVAIGVALATAFALLPVGLIGHVIGIGIGFVMIPGGLAAIVKAAATIARSNRVIRDHAPPSARVID